MEMSPLHPVIPAANLGETLNSNQDDQKASTVLPQHFDGEHACDKKGSKDAKIVTNLAPRNSNPLLPTGANFPMHTPGWSNSSVIFSGTTKSTFTRPLKIKERRFFEYLKYKK